MFNIFKALNLSLENKNLTLLNFYLLRRFLNENNPNIKNNHRNSNPKSFMIRVKLQCKNSPILEIISY